MSRVVGRGGRGGFLDILSILPNKLAQCCLNVGNVSETGIRKTFTAHTKRSPNVESLSVMSA